MIYSRMKACFGILKAGAGNVAGLATRGPYSRIQPQGATPSSSVASRRDPSRNSRHGQAKTRRDSTEGLFKAHFPPAYVSGGGSNRSPRRHSSLPNINLPPLPPYYPKPSRKGVLNVEMPIMFTPPLVSPGYKAVDQGDLEAGTNFSEHPRPLSPAHVRINAFVFLVAIIILAMTVTLFYLLHLDERGASNPAGFFVVLTSCATIASALVTIHRLENQVPNNGQATWPTTMVIGIPLVFLTCTILSFIVFLVGLSFASLLD